MREQQGSPAAENDSWGGEPWTEERANAEREGTECPTCHREYTREEMVDATIPCPTCHCRSGDPYSVFDPFHCNTCGGTGKVPLVVEDPSPAAEERGGDSAIDPNNELPEFKAEWEPHVEACWGNIRYLANDQVMRLYEASSEEAKRRRLAHPSPTSPAVEERGGESSYQRVIVSDKVYLREIAPHCYEDVPPPSPTSPAAGAAEVEDAR